MIPVELQTRDGEIVTQVGIPPFKMLPEVLVWGDRTFTLDMRASLDAALAGNKAYVYREAFTYVVPETEGL